MSQNVGVDASKLITLAAKLIGVFSVGQTLQPQDVQDCFDQLNFMIAEWNEQRLAIPYLLDVNFPCDGSLSYTIGPGGKINTVCPLRLESAYQTNNGVNTPLRIIHAKEDWSRITLPTLTSFPDYIFLDTQYPLGILKVWPIPTNAYSITLQLMAQLAQFQYVTDQVALRPGYYNAILYNLAVAIAPVFTVPVPRAVATRATTARRSIEKNNTQIKLLQVSPDLNRRGHYNIYSDRST